MVHRPVAAAVTHQLCHRYPRRGERRARGGLAQCDGDRDLLLRPGGQQLRQPLVPGRRRHQLFIRPEGGLHLGAGRQMQVDSRVEGAGDEGLGEGAPRVEAHVHLARPHAGRPRRLGRRSQRAGRQSQRACPHPERRHAAARHKLEARDGRGVLGGPWYSAGRR
eukprot:scaffold18968_cov114-Isochrysis_galbana.AAC.5